MNIIDLDQALIVDPRPFLKRFYKRGKPAADIVWDDYAAWNVLIESVKKAGGFFASDYAFKPGRMSDSFKFLNTVDLLDEDNNVVVTLNPKNSVRFDKDGVSYVAFGPFVVKHFSIPLLNVPEEQPVTVVEDEGQSLEYLDEVV